MLQFFFAILVFFDFGVSEDQINVLFVDPSFWNEVTLQLSYNKTASLVWMKPSRQILQIFRIKEPQNPGNKPVMECSSILSNWYLNSALRENNLK